jgi:hypothetical protein
VTTPADEEARRERARIRAQRRWLIERFRLGGEPVVDAADGSTPEERVALMWPLARHGWALAGRDLPRYERAQMPTRLFRAGEPGPSDDGAERSSS